MHPHFKSGYSFWSPHLTQRQKNYKRYNAGRHRWSQVWNGFCIWKTKIMSLQTGRGKEGETQECVTANDKRKVYRKWSFIISSKKYRTLTRLWYSRLKSNTRKCVYIYIYNSVQCKIWLWNSLAQIMRMFKIQMKKCTEGRFLQGYWTQWWKYSFQSWSLSNASCQKLNGCAGV